MRLAKKLGVDACASSFGITYCGKDLGDDSPFPIPVIEGSFDFSAFCTKLQAKKLKEA